MEKQGNYRGIYDPLPTPKGRDEKEELRRNAPRLIQELQSQWDTGVEELKKAGYDYDRMLGYDQMLRDAQGYEARQKNLEKFAGEHPVWASLSSIGMAPLQGFEFAGKALTGIGHSDTGDLKSYVPMNPYNMNITNTVNTLRGTVAAEIEKNTDWELFGQNVASFLYQTGMSIGDSALQVGTLGKAATLFMGGSAAASQAQSVMTRGGSNRQAFWGGLAAGAAEMLFEYVSIENLLKPRTVDGWKSFLKETAKQAGVEGSEELFTEIANILTDTAIMGNKSETALKAAAYQNQGMSWEEAQKQTFLDCVGQVAWAAAGGTLSGGVMGGGVNGANWAGNVQTALVDDATADKLLNDRNTIEFLTEKGGLKLTKDMTREQKRAAIKEAIGSVAGGQKTASHGGDGETHYSLKAFADGRRFVDVDTDQAQFDGLTFEQLGYQARKAIKEKFKGKVIGIENRAFVNGNTAEEYGRPVKKLSPQEHEAKMRASAELDNLLDAGTNFRTKEDGQDGHIHPEATGDFRYFDTIFKVGDEYYEGVINVKPVKKGLLLKDITNIRNITQKIRASYGENPQGSFLRDASMNSISQSSQKDNREISTSDPTKTSELAQQQDTHSLTEADAKRFATKEGTEWGLVLDDYVQNRLQTETAELINTVAQALGVRVRFVNSVRGGTANASIQDGEVLIERYNPNPVLYLLGHEMTHRIQQLAPKKYTRFKEAVRADVEKEAQGLYTLYQNRGVKISFEGAIDEATANYAGRLIQNGTVLDEFIERHQADRSLLERVLDAIRSMIDKLTGQEKQNAQTAEEKLAAALDEAAKKAGKAGNKNTATQGGEEAYLIKELPDGRKYVKADRQVIFGSDPASWGEQLENYINGKIRRGEDVQLIAEDGTILTLTKDTAGKVSSPYTSKGTTLPEGEYYTKVNAGAHIDELVAISQKHGRVTKDYGGRHGDFAKSGWSYRDAYFLDFDGRYYKVDISVARGIDGNVVYNIGSMQERSFPSVTGSST